MFSSYFYRFVSYFDLLYTGSYHMLTCYIHMFLSHVSCYIHMLLSYIPLLCISVLRVWRRHGQNVTAVVTECGITQPWRRLVMETCSSRRETGIQSKRYLLLYGPSQTRWILHGHPQVLWDVILDGVLEMSHGGCCVTVSQTHMVHTVMSTDISKDQTAQKAHSNPAAKTESNIMQAQTRSPQENDVLMLLLLQLLLLWLLLLLHGFAGDAARSAAVAVAVVVSYVDTSADTASNTSSVESCYCT